MSPRTAEPVCPPAEAEGASGGALAGWARRFRPLHGAPVRTRLPPRPPVRPLLVGGGAGWELMPPALVRLCPVASGVLRVVLSLLVVPGVTCSPWIRSVFGFRVRGFEFIIDIIYPSWDCVFCCTRAFMFPRFGRALIQGLVRCHVSLSWRATPCSRSSADGLL